MATLRLKRLQIDRFRNVAPGTVLVFNDGMNVLLGPNGSGKTTLLRLIAAIVRDDLKSLAEEELDITYDLALPSTILRVKLSNRRGTGNQINDLATSQRGSSDWQFRVSVPAVEGAEWLIMEGSPLGVLDQITQKSRPVRDPLRERGPVTQWTDAVAQIAFHVMESSGVGEPIDQPALKFALLVATDLLELKWSEFAQGGRFDEALGVFDAIVRYKAVQDTADRPPVYLFRGKQIHGRFLPEELRLSVERLPKEIIGSDIVLTHESLPFLRRVVDLLGAKHARMTLRLEEKRRDDTEYFSSFEFLFTLDDGTVIRHDLLSWGQKRLLSFFYYAAANPDILVVDELVNGLHHEWINACLKEMEGRQCFLTSQNPLLLDQLVFQSAEDVRRTFIQCRREKGERRAELHWHPMDEASAESFFRAYRVGIQHVGEILRTKGLW